MQPKSTLRARLTVRSLIAKVHNDATIDIVPSAFRFRLCSNEGQQLITNETNQITPKAYLQNPSNSAPIQVQGQLNSLSSARFQSETEGQISKEKYFIYDFGGCILECYLTRRNRQNSIEVSLQVFGIELQLCSILNIEVDYHQPSKRYSNSFEDSQTQKSNKIFAQINSKLITCYLIMSQDYNLDTMNHYQPYSGSLNGEQCEVLGTQVTQSIHPRRSEHKKLSRTQTEKDGFTDFLKKDDRSVDFGCFSTKGKLEQLIKSEEFDKRTKSQKSDSYADEDGSGSFNGRAKRKLRGLKQEMAKINQQLKNLTELRQAAETTEEQKRFDKQTKAVRYSHQLLQLRLNLLEQEIGGPQLEFKGDEWGDTVSIRSLENATDRETIQALSKELQFVKNLLLETQTANRNMSEQVENLKKQRLEVQQAHKVTRQSLESQSFQLKVLKSNLEATKSELNSTLSQMRLLQYEHNQLKMHHQKCQQRSQPIQKLTQSAVDHQSPILENKTKGTPEASTDLSLSPDYLVQSQYTSPHISHHIIFPKFTVDKISHPNGLQISMNAVQLDSREKTKQHTIVSRSTVVSQRQSEKLSPIKKSTTNQLSPVANMLLRKLQQFSEDQQQLEGGLTKIQRKIRSAIQTIDNRTYNGLDKQEPLSVS